MSFDQYQKWTRTTAVHPNVNALPYLTLGLTGEAGEVANKLKKVLRDGRDTPTLEETADLIDELGDVCWYVARLSAHLGISLSKVINDNMCKLEQRKKAHTLKTRSPK